MIIGVSKSGKTFRCQRNVLIAGFFQFAGVDVPSKQLSKQAIIDGLQDFVESFQFYEYYPRKKMLREIQMIYTLILAIY